MIDRPGKPARSEPGRRGPRRRKPKLAEVITLHPALDVPRMLREMADNIEKGDVFPVRSVTAVVEHTDGDC